MAEYLRVDTAGRAVEIVQVPPCKTLADLMHPDLAAMCYPRGDAQIGWIRTSDGAWQPPAEPEASPPAPVTRAQAKIQLLRAGHLDQVRTLLETSEAENAAEMRLWFEEALTWEYDNPYVIAVAGELGLSDERRAELFRAAARIAA